MRRLGWFTGWVVTLAATSSALADVPPPEGYVEKCTVAKQQTTTTECLTCASMHGQTDRCASVLAPYCYVYVCQTYGASAWTEVLCRAKDPNAPAVPADVSAQLASPPASWLADAGVATPPSTCAPYVPGPQDQPSDGSGCSLPSTRSPLRELGPAVILLGVLALIIRQRRRR